MTDQGWMLDGNQQQSTSSKKVDQVKGWQQESSNGRGNSKNSNSCVESTSELTIYQNAMPLVDNMKRSSSPSEEDELYNSSGKEYNQITSGLLTYFAINAAYCSKELAKVSSRQHGKYVEDGELPHSLSEAGTREQTRPETAEEKADQIIKDAERSKARIFEVPGRIDFDHTFNNQSNQWKSFFQAAMVMMAIS